MVLGRCGGCRTVQSDGPHVSCICKTLACTQDILLSVEYLRSVEEFKMDCVDQKQIGGKQGVKLGVYLRILQQNSIHNHVWDVGFVSSM